MANDLENDGGNLYNYAPSSAGKIVLALNWPPVTSTFCKLLNIVRFRSSCQSGGLGMRNENENDVLANYEE